MNLELESESLENILAAIADQARLEDNLRILIDRRAGGYVLSMHTCSGDEPEITS